MRKAHEAKRAARPDMTIWGTGSPRREFLHVDDCADALVHLMKTWSDAVPVNVGCGADISIAELAELIMRIAGLTGRLWTDPSKPDGTPRKLMDASVLRGLGWAPSMTLEDGLRDVYEATFQGDEPKSALA